MLRITASRKHVWVTRRPAHTLKHTHNRVFVAANVPSDSFPHFFRICRSEMRTSSTISSFAINTRRRRSGRIITPSAVHALRPFSLPFCGENPKKGKEKRNKQKRNEFPLFASELKASRTAPPKR